MSRTMMEIAFNRPFEEAENAIVRILQNHHFFEFNYNAECVWKRYNDALGATASQYLKIEYTSTGVHLEAWVGNDGYSQESELKGFVGGLPKKVLRKIIEEIQMAV